MSGTDLEILIPKLRRFARCLYCSSIEADDAVCDSLEAAMAAGQVDNDDIVTTETWLFNAMIAAARRRFANDGRHLPPVAIAAVPGDIEKAMAELSIEHRAIVALHVLEGIGIEDAAAILGASVSEVRRNLVAARSHLSAHSTTGREFTFADSIDASENRV